MRPGLGNSVAAQSQARTPVRLAAPSDLPDLCTSAGAGPGADVDAGAPAPAEDIAAGMSTPAAGIGAAAPVGQQQEHQRADGGEESFDTEFALLQLEWPQPIGAIRSEGELAPPTVQLPLPPSAGNNLVSAAAEDGGAASQH